MSEARARAGAIGALLLVPVILLLGGVAGYQLTWRVGHARASCLMHLPACQIAAVCNCVDIAALFASGIFALLNGGRDQRRMAGLFVAVTSAQIALQLGYLAWPAFGYGTLSVLLAIGGLVALIGSIVVAVFASSWWMMWIAAANLMGGLLPLMLWLGAYTGISSLSERPANLLGNLFIYAALVISTVQARRRPAARPASS